MNLINNKILGSTGSFTVDLSERLDNFGSIILGNGNNIIAVAENINNSGYLISQNNLTINSKDLINDGQIASGNILILNSENILNGNYSLIYSANDMTITLKEDFINNKGEVHSGNNAEIKALGKVQNNAGIIEAVGDIYIEGAQIENLGEIAVSYSASGGTDGEYARNMAYISSGKGITLKTIGDVVNREGNILAGRDVNVTAYRLINGNIIDYNNDEKYEYNAYSFYEDEKKEVEVYDKKLSLTESFTQKAETDRRTKISAGNKINISAIQIGNGALLTEENLVNNKYVNIEQIIVDSSNVERTGTINTEDYITIPEGDKGLFSVSRDLINSRDISIDAKEKTDVGKDEILKRDNSVLNEKIPEFTYLIETNVKYTDMGYYLGSDYFFRKIGYNPERDIRLLGDSFYESRIVNRAIFESTGKRYLNGAANEKEQMQILLDNSIKAMEDFSLSIGIALTKEQINNLKDDIIWYVEEEVNGVKVLVPKVYLSKETLASLIDNQIDIAAGN